MFKKKGEGRRERVRQLDREENRGGGKVTQDQATPGTSIKNLE